MTLLIISGLLFIINFICLLPFQHWIFRVPEFAKIQVTVLAYFFLIFLLFNFSHNYFYYTSLILVIAIISLNTFQLIPFLPLSYFRYKDPTGKLSDEISIISCNVYQYNDNKSKFQQLIEDTNPDMFLTLESDEEWEKSYQIFNKTYPHQLKKALSNTYGIHFYSKLSIIEGDIVYEVSDDIPSVQAILETEDGYQFNFYGLHPPPPSPTEEETSKERDGELLKVAKKINKNKESSVLVCGDFNNVAWAKSSRLFRKISGLIDPRHGRGFVSTYHAKYKLFRFPIDLCFHSPNIKINKFKTLKNIDSDHFPLFVKFQISNHVKQQDLDRDISQDEKEKIDHLIDEGEKEQGER